MYKIVKFPVSLLGLLILFLFSSSLSNCSIKVAKEDKLGKEQKFRSNLLKSARAQIGTKYRYAGKTPKGFDCSGFTGYVFKQQNLWLDASSRLQAKQGKEVKIKNAKPGDLVFFGNSFKIDHVGIITQNNKGKLYVIHSTNSQGVVEHDVNQILYWKKRLKFARDVISP